LSQFGTWSHLGSTTSSATDVYPGTATLSFRTAVYHSTELTLRTTELADNAGRPLQAQTPLDTRVIDAFDVPPYVNTADQIASQLSNPWSPVAQAIDGSAQAIIAALDQVLRDKSAPLRAPGVSGGRNPAGRAYRAGAAAVEASTFPRR
jgi:hypothetical protein